MTCMNMSDPFSVHLQLDVVDRRRHWCHVIPQSDVGRMLTPHGDVICVEDATVRPISTVGYGPEGAAVHDGPERRIREDLLRGVDEGVDLGLVDLVLERDEHH